MELCRIFGRLWERLCATALMRTAMAGRGGVEIYKLDIYVSAKLQLPYSWLKALIRKLQLRP
eukprot:326383-Hanusia_phi.AAC.1